MKFVKVDEDVFSVELSRNALERIGNALRENESSDERDQALGKGFLSAANSEAFNGIEIPEVDVPNVEA